MAHASHRPADLRGALRLAALGVAVFAAAWTAVHLDAFSAFELVDTPVYESYGTAMVEGELPYRDFALEYPPGALPMFVVPSVVSPGNYRAAFEVVQGTLGAALLVAAVLTLARLGASRGKIALAALSLGALPLLLGPVVLTRFDLWPAALLGLALLALAYERPRTSLVVLALAASAKLYAVVVVPLALVHVARRYGGAAALQAAVAFGLALAAVVGPFLALSPDGVVDALRRQTERPLQVESLGASVFGLGEPVGLYRGSVETSFGSQNLVGSAPEAAASLTTALQLLAVIAIWGLFARLKPARAADPSVMLGAAAAAVVAFVALGKVFSPQFMIWVAAAAPLALGRGRLRAGEVVVLALLSLALVLTHLWFPSRYWALVAFDSDQLATLVARNVAVATLAGLLAARWLRTPRLDGAPERLAA